MRLLLLFPLLVLAHFTSAQNPFDLAYANHPTLPDGLLEAVAWTNTRMVHLEQQQEGCSGYPQAYGIMGLHDDGKGYFNENGAVIAIISGISISTQKTSAVNQVEAYARSLESLLNGATDAISIRNVLHQLSEIPDTGMVNLLARDMQAYEVLKFMSRPEKALEFGFTAHHFNLSNVFGSDNFAILSGKKIHVSETGITDDLGHAFTINANASLQYTPAIWNPAANCNYSSRSGTAVSAITIHTIQGTYAGAISWAQNCNSSVSYHYVVRSSDGQITQMVLEEDKAWHVGSENPYTIGYEHEGYVNDPSWYTDAMYEASADLSRDIINSGYGIPSVRTYYGASSSSTNVIGACTRIKGHQHYPNQTHTDPGINWNWEKYYRLINNNPSITTITAASGTHTDSGGATGNYTDDERILWLIQPANVTSITLDFTSFNLEINYDYLFIYDGDSIGAPLIGQYTGTASPGIVTSSGGSLLLEFRSDCGTTTSGWIANYTSVPTDVFPPNTTIVTNSIWHNDDFNVSFIDTDAETSIHDRFYLVSEKSLGAIAPKSNGNYGFVNESFEDNANYWQSVTGTFALQNGVYTFNDTTQQNSNCYYNVSQSNIGTYLFEWEQKITSNASNQRAGMHFFCDDPTQTNRGNSYFVYLRTNDDLVQIYSVSNNVFTLEESTPLALDPNINYQCRVIYNPNTGKIRVFVDGTFVSEWTDATPLQTGSAISMRTGGCIAEFDNVRVYHSRGTSVTILAGLGEEMSIESESAVPTGMVYSVVTDSLDNWSTVSEEVYLLDFSNPEIIVLNDGTGADIDTFELATIEANWTAQDIHSGIQEYEVAIGTLPNLDNVAPWTSNGLQESFSYVLSAPVSNQLYYISLRVTNQAGLEAIFLSDGQRYLNDLGVHDPMLSKSILYPNPASASFSITGLTKSVEVFIYDASGKICLSHVLAPGKNISLDRLSAGNYRVIVRDEHQFVVRELVVIK